MSEREHPPQPEEARESRRFPHALSPAQEGQILARVRQDVLGRYLQGDDTGARLSWLQWSMGGALAAAMAVAIVWWGGWSSIPLQQRGFQAQQTKHSKQPLLLQASAAQPGSLERARRWRIDTEGNTRIALHKGTERRQRIALQTGYLKIHVTPRQMKRFAVSAAGYRVEVKGTRFSVERRKGYVKVEVWRGKVVLHTPEKTTRAITKGQGCRAALPSQELRCYRLPPKASKKAAARLRWLSKHNPAQLPQFVTDLAHNPRWSREQRATFLRDAVELFLKAKRWRNAIKGNQLLASLQVADSNQALVDAALQCRRHLRNSRLCQDIFKQCLRHCKDRTWQEQSLGMLALSEYQQAKDGQARAQAASTILQYLKRYPQGTWQKDLRRLLVRHAITQGQSCKRARALLAPGDKGEGWFVQRCPPAR